jgi:hypothetical protein
MTVIRETGVFILTLIVGVAALLAAFVAGLIDGATDALYDRM